MSSPLSDHHQEVILAPFSLYMHKGGIKSLNLSAVSDFFHLVHVTAHRCAKIDGVINDNITHKNQCFINTRVAHTSN